MATVMELAKRQGSSIPPEHRRNFIHLYADIAWYGVLSGSAIAFMAVYATRLGAAGWQIGLLNASPAIISLVFTLPSGMWLQKSQQISRHIFWTSIAHRLFYLPWVLLPLFFAPQTQIWVLIGLVLLMSIPGTALAVGFNAMFAATVPSEWRTHVTGVRNALLAVMFIVTSLVSGWLLNILPFPLGYQVVFGLGTLGALLSSLHLWYIRPQNEATYTPGSGQAFNDMARPGILRVWMGGMRTAVNDWRFLLNWRPQSKNKPRQQMDAAFRRILLVLFLFHFAQHLAAPLFPIYWVNDLHLTDQDIGLGNAVFYVFVLLTSTQLTRLIKRASNFRLLVFGFLGLSLYPVITSVIYNLTTFLFVSAVGGTAWGVISGCLANYLLENMPENKRPFYLAWYHLALNAAVLLGSLGGPLLADRIGLVGALIVIGIARAATGIIFWRIGRQTPQTT